MPRLKIVDIGAMISIEGEDLYARLLKATPCEIIGFEPVAAELDKLNRTAKENQRFLPYFIGDGSTRTFYECNTSMTSSLFEPNTPLLLKFQSLEEHMQVVRSYPVETTRLDDVPEVQGSDFLKVDIQGAALMAFQGGVKLLQDALVIQTEVEFVPLYKNQPLFSDVDAFLRHHGFCFHTVYATGRTFKPLIANNDVNAAMRQILWADAIYVRDFMSFDQLAPVALLKLACILHEVYQSFDLAALALEAHDRQTGARTNQSYIQRLANPNA